MKRIIVAIMVIFLAFSFWGCSSSSTEKPIVLKENKVTEISNAIEENEPIAAETKEPEPEIAEISFEELIVVDNDECAITITEIDPDNLWGYTVKVSLRTDLQIRPICFRYRAHLLTGFRAIRFLLLRLHPEKNQTMISVFWMIL